MKLTKASKITQIIEVEVYADHIILHDISDNGEVAAAIDFSEFDIPTGPVISKDRNRVTQRMIDDFEGLMDDVEIVCEQKLGLIGTYKHVSDDHSHYYNYLASDEAGNIIIDFRLRLRISNHHARRNRQQQQNKKSELMSEKLNKLLTKDQINRLTTYTKVITVNDEEYTSYRQAFEDIVEIIEHAVEVMTRKVN